MKLTTHNSIEFKATHAYAGQSINANGHAQMIAPGGSSCTLGCSCSCSCGATKGVDIN